MLWLAFLARRAKGLKQNDKKLHGSVVNSGGTAVKIESSVEIGVEIHAFNYTLLPVLLLGVCWLQRSELILMVQWLLLLLLRRVCLGKISDEVIDQVGVRNSLGVAYR